MATLVTAFMTNVNNIGFRSYEKYIELGKILLNQPIPTVCFLEKHIYDQYFSSSLNLFPYTHFIMFEKEDNYLVQYQSELCNYFVNTDNPTKDTPGYMFVQCHKTEWIRQAIQANPFCTSDFIWVDFGIFHMIRDKMEFALQLDAISRKKQIRVRIASCVNPNQNCHYDPFHTITWYFAGSIFGGNAEFLLNFADKMRELCLHIIHQRKHIMWEVNIWYLLYKQYPSIFSPYLCNHDISILSQY